MVSPGPYDPLDAPAPPRSRGLTALPPPRTVRRPPMGKKLKKSKDEASAPFAAAPETAPAAEAPPPPAASTAPLPLTHLPAADLGAFFELSFPDKRLLEL